MAHDKELFHVILENASSYFVFNKISGLKLLTVLCDDRVLALMMHPLAQVQQGEDCSEASRTWLNTTMGANNAAQVFPGQEEAGLHQTLS